MTSDRWEEINRLYNAAVEVEAKERTSFLEKACEGDQELRREVESLLAYDQQAQQLWIGPRCRWLPRNWPANRPHWLGENSGLTRFKLCWAPEEWERFTKPKTLG